MAIILVLMTVSGNRQVVRLEKTTTPLRKNFRLSSVAQSTSALADITADVSIELISPQDLLQRR